MKKTRVFILVSLSLILLCRAGEAFIPKAPHLLYLVIEAIKQPVGIEALQIKKIINYTDIESPVTEFEERLIFDFPDRLRSELMSGPATGFSIEAQNRYVKILDGVIVSRAKPLLDRYADILLCRDYEVMIARLIKLGIDTDTVGMTRYNDTICYVIGAPQDKGEAFPGLWIEKDSFLPVKFVVIDEGRAMEVLYEKWERFSKTWYPMQTAIFLDDRLYGMLNVQSVKLEASESDALFDIDYVLRTYPEKQPGDEVMAPSGQVDGSDKGMNDSGELLD